MPKQISTDQLKELARAGAEARLAELDAERATLLRAFPGLQGGRSARPPAATARKGRRAMSPAERKVVSARMKAYWAARRGATKKR